MVNEAELSLRDFLGSGNGKIGLGMFKPMPKCVNVSIEVLSEKGCLKPSLLA